MFALKGEVVSAIARPLGVGIVLGAAIVYFLQKGLPMMGRLIDDWGSARTGRMSGIALIVCAGVLSIAFGFSLALSVLAIVGAFAMAYIGARATAEMNVDPMEIFAMLIMIIAKMFLGFEALPLIVLACVVTIAAGMAGDMMQDLKAGFLLGTKLEHQIIAQVVGMAAASLAIGAIVLSIQATYGIGTLDFPAPQAVAIKELVSGQGLESMLEYGMLIGGGLTAIIWFLKPKLGMIAIAFGIGMYVPIELSLPLFIGGLIRLYFDRTKRTEKGRLIAAGAIAGEGLAGVAFALIGFAGILFN